jgi:dienelactone hydrolase
MSLIAGEGRVAILYGTSPLPVPPATDVYLARPDYAGAHPAVLIVPDAGITPSVKALCRRIARFGYAALGMDLAGNGVPGAPARRVDAALEALLSVARDEWSTWCGADRFVALGIGHGSLPAARLAAFGAGAAVIIPDSIDGLGDPLATLEIPLLALVGGRSSDEVRRVRDVAGRGEWVVFASTGPGFFDDDSDEYDRGSAEEAFRRFIEFLDGRLARVEAG